ncbi:MAG: methyltransferase domain-containing protein [Spirochaetes bacterium]|nr:methyltransferase domain-containing protein [Spirochaetota bacterium]
MKKPSRATGDADLPDRDADALFRLQRGLTGDRALIGAGYMDDPELSRAYRLFYGPVSRAQAERAFSVAGLSPRSVLDLGAGSGAFASAAADRGAVRVTLVDSSRRALDLAMEALSGHGIPAPTTVVADLSSDFTLPEGSFGCAVFGHSLNELWKDEAGRIEKRAGLVDRISNNLESGGTVLVVEPATLACGRDALALRDELERRDWTIIAPCTRSGPCPALAAGPEQTCRDDVEWTPPETVRLLAARVRLDKDILKMTWFAACKPGADTTPAVNADRGKAAYRVVSEGMLNKAGRVRFLICGPGGRFGFSAKRGDQAAGRAGFFALRRGDLLSVADPEPRENGWGFGRSTVIHRH